MKRLLLDQGLPRSTGSLLIASGWDICHVSEIGMSQADDAAILEQARLDNRVCVTLDADFHALLATSGERMPSVVRIRKEGLNAPALAALLQAVWPRVESAVADGAMCSCTWLTRRHAWRPSPADRFFSRASDG